MREKGDLQSYYASKNQSLYIVQCVLKVLFDGISKCDLAEPSSAWYFLAWVSEEGVWTKDNFWV